MCGFAGIVAWEDRYRFDRAMLGRMSARIAHRGPDGEGLWINHDGEVNPGRPQVGLAHRRLAIIDLDERANQPFTDGRGRWLAFNGEIYNYRELRRELEGLLPDYPWRTQSDTEVLLASYAAWGPLCFSHLTGMFAAAIWDEPARKFVLGRDRMGQKPLFIARGEGFLAFASELRALGEFEPVDRRISESELEHYLRWGYTSGPGSIYQGTEQLLPGWAEVWETDPESGSFSGNAFTYELSEYPRPKPLSDAHAVEHTRAFVLKAVHQQMVADVPLGCFLSGGIDSSVIAAAMKRAAGPDQRVLSFSIGFDDPRYDETEYAARVAAHVGTTHHAFVVRPDAATDLPKLAEVFGEPFGDSSALPTHYLSRETRGHVKVALSGDGGDELFGGYDRYRAIRYSHWARWVPRHGRAAVARPLATLLKGGHPKSRRARAERFLSSLERSPGQRYASYIELMSMPLITELLGRPPEGDGISGWFNALLREYDAVGAARAIDIASYLPGDLLTKVDRASMLHALEVRSPFMDHELVAFARTLSTPQLLKGGPKRMLREAFAPDLAAWVFKRRKMGFAVPIGEWFRGDLRPMLRDHLFAADSFAAAHFNRPVVERLVEEHERERVDHSQRLYALLMIELWWRGQK
jgi:asparagine synthase (glutamine-hydrolysing)